MFVDIFAGPHETYRAPKRVCMQRNLCCKLDMDTGHPMVTSDKISNHSASNQEVYSNPIEMYISKYNNAFILYVYLEDFVMGNKTSFWSSITRTIHPPGRCTRISI